MIQFLSNLHFVGCKISFLSSLSTTKGPETERDQVGVPKVRESCKAKISQNTPEESLCRSQLHIL